jgi:chromosome segregation ATPase
MITLNQEEEALKSHIKKLNDELLEKTDIRDALIEEIASLNGAKEVSVSDVKKISNTRDNIISEFETISEQLSTTQSQIEDNLLKKKLDLEKSVETLKTEVSNLESSLATTQSLNESLNTTKEQLEASVANLATVRDSYIDLNEKANTEYSNKTSQVKEIDFKIMTLEAEVKSLLEAKTTTNNEIGKAQNDLIAIRKEEYQLKQNIDVMKSKEADLDQKEAILKEEFEKQGLTY